MKAPPGGDQRRPGRPRDARADEAIMDAAVAVLADRGPAGFTVDEVASRAGCGKATVYRRWPSRAALLLDSMAALAARCDMRELVVRAHLHRARLGDPSALASARLLGTGIDNPALAQLLHDPTPTRWNR